LDELLGVFNIGLIIEP